MGAFFPFKNQQKNLADLICHLLHFSMGLDILQSYSIAPSAVVPQPIPLRISTPHVGDKRSASDFDDDDMDSPLSPDAPSLTFSSGGSDSDSSQVRSHS